MRAMKLLFIALVASVLALGLAACDNDDGFDQPQQPDQQFSVQADQQAPDTQAGEGDWDFPEDDDEDDDYDAPEW